MKPKRCTSDSCTLSLVERMLRYEGDWPERTGWNQNPICQNTNPLKNKMGRKYIMVKEVGKQYTLYLPTPPYTTKGSEIPVIKGRQKNKKQNTHAQKNLNLLTLISWYFPKLNSYFDNHPWHLHPGMREYKVWGGPSIPRTDKKSSSPGPKLVTWTTWFMLDSCFPSGSLAFRRVLGRGSLHCQPPIKPLDVK